MFKRLLLWLVLFSAGLMSVAEALPCITQTTQSAAKVGCMAAMGMAPQADHDAMKGCAAVSECFKQPALPAEVEAATAPASHESTAYAILSDSIQPVALQGQYAVRPPPLPDGPRYTPTHQFLASLSRWLI